MIAAMASLHWMLPLAIAACGGSTSSAAGEDGGNDGPVTDAAGGDTSSDASGLDAPYLACMSASGQLDASLKACQSDSDCTIQQEQTDCCGTTLFVGVSMTSVTAFNACQSSWLMHFPGCGCASAATMTEDGKMSYTFRDSAAPVVQCMGADAGMGTCMTSTP
jgi:hypothetical protein